jgi:hypothetical protein
MQSLHTVNQDVKDTKQLAGAQEENVPLQPTREPLVVVKLLNEVI